MSTAADKRAAAERAPKREPAPRLSGAALRRGLIAGALAWVFPGAGHYFAGARRRAFVFCGLMALTLGLGLANDGNLSVYDARTPWISRAKVVANVAIGPFEPLLRTALYGAPVYSMGDGRSPRDPALVERRERAFRPASAYGTAYLMALGLMNLLLIIDAWDIGIGRKK